MCTEATARKVEGACAFEVVACGSSGVFRGDSEEVVDDWVVALEKVIRLPVL